MFSCFLSPISSNTIGKFYVCSESKVILKYEILKKTKVFSSHLNLGANFLSLNYAFATDSVVLFVRRD